MNNKSNGKSRLIWVRRRIASSIETEERLAKRVYLIDGIIGSRPRAARCSMAVPRGVFCSILQAINRLRLPAVASG